MARKFSEKELRAITIAGKCMFEDTLGLEPQRLYDWFWANSNEDHEIYVKEIYRNVCWEDCLLILDDMIATIASEL